MALVTSQFSKVQNLNPAAGQSVQRQLFWCEAGADSVATVVAAGYFNSVRNLLRVGDRIHVVAATNTAKRELHVATVPATGNVTTVALAYS